MKPNTQKLRIIVAGLVGQYPLGGVAWDYFHYLLGLSALGHDVYYYEDTWVWPFDPVSGFPRDDPQPAADFIREFFERYAPKLARSWQYVFLHDTRFGMSRQQFDPIARTADIFLNLSGACFFPEHLNPACKRVFLDTDPGYNQIMLHERFPWSQNIERWCEQVQAHDVHLTYAENIYGNDCVIPRMHFDWRPTRCVVTLSPWNDVKNRPPPRGAPFTTVMTWNWFGGKLMYKGVQYEQKVPEYERFRELPKRTDVPLALCVGGHKTPFEQIRNDGWKVIDAHQATLTPQAYVDFIGGSAGEWSVAKNVYVATRSAWFSCRTACYLAAGRPAVVQETGWSKFLPCGGGLMTFDTMDGAIAALEGITSDWKPHAKLAYDIAREYLTADRILPGMLEAIFSNSASNAPRPPGIR